MPIVVKKFGHHGTPPLTPAEEEIRVANRMEVSAIDGYLVCVLCDKRFWSMECASDHLQSARHLYALKQVAWKEFVSDPENSTMGNVHWGIPNEIECRGDSWFRCTVCECMLWCVDSILDHCKGRKHCEKLACEKLIRPAAQIALIAHPTVYTPSPIDSLPAPRAIPPPPSHVPMDELPCGFRFLDESLIECEICVENFSSILEAWRHSCGCSHLCVLDRFVRNLFAKAEYMQVGDVLWCELCDSLIDRPSHFKSGAHSRAIGLLQKFNCEYFQPFICAGNIKWIRWSEAKVDSAPNPQLLINQWSFYKGGKIPLWKISCISETQVTAMLAHALRAPHA